MADEIQYVYKDPTLVNISQKVSAFFQKYFWFNKTHLCFKICCDFQISKIYQDFATESDLETFGETNCFGTTRLWKKLKMSATFLMSGIVSKFLEFLGSLKCWDLENNIC